MLLTTVCVQPRNFFLQQMDDYWTSIPINSQMRTKDMPNIHPLLNKKMEFVVNYKKQKSYVKSAFSERWWVNLVNSRHWLLKGQVLAAPCWEPWNTAFSLWRSRWKQGQENHLVIIHLLLWEICWSWTWDTVFEPILYHFSQHIKNSMKKSKQNTLYLIIAKLWTDTWERS